MTKIMSEAEVAELRSLWREADATSGLVYDRRGEKVPPNPKFRVCEVMQAPTPGWLRDRYDIGETVNLVRYRPGGHIDWHADEAEQRRSVVIVGLSDDYEGGELDYGSDTVTLHSGDVVRFPVTTKHRVRPVTSGERMVAIGWVF